MGTTDTAIACAGGTTSAGRESLSSALLSRRCTLRSRRRQQQRSAAQRRCACLTRRAAAAARQPGPGCWAFCPALAAKASRSPPWARPKRAARSRPARGARRRRRRCAHRVATRAGDAHNDAREKAHTLVHGFALTRTRRRCRVCCVPFRAPRRVQPEEVLPDREQRLEFARPFWEALSKSERHALLKLPLDALAARAAATDVGARLRAAPRGSTRAHAARRARRAARHGPCASLSPAKGIREPPAPMLTVCRGFCALSRPRSAAAARQTLRGRAWATS
jgi:hypothetical protein